MPIYKIKWWYKTEKLFMHEIMWLLRKDWYICFHPRDVWLSFKFLDCHYISPDWNKLWWIEFKKIKKDTFNVSQFEESQVVLLKKLDKINPDIVRIFIYSIGNNDYLSLKFSTIRGNKNDKWWIKLWNKWIKLFDNEF